MKRILTFLSVCFLIISNTSAQWSNNPDDPLAICNVVGNQIEPFILSDGEEGSFVFWIDWRDAHGAVYGQHLDKNGNALWDASGKAIIDYADKDAAKVRAVLNNDGDIILAWQHYLSGSSPDTLYAQKLNTDGDALWANAVAVAGNNLSDGGSFWGPLDFTIMANGGGCFFAVQTMGYGYNFLLINKMDADGNLPWGYNGKIFDGFLSAYNLKLLSDGEGGAFLSWEYNHDYLQRFNTDGDLFWSEAIDMNACTGGAGGTYAGFPYCLIAPDGSGGIMSAWSSLGRDIYAARINADGSFSWGDSCSAIYTDEYTQEEIAFSKAGDAYYVSWIDSRPDAVGIYMQKFNNSGETEWTEPLYVEDTSIYIPVLKSVATSEGDIALFYQAAGGFYAQKVHPDGSTEWSQPIEILGNDYVPSYVNYNLMATDDGNVIGVAETGYNIGDQNIHAFNLNFISGDTIAEDTTTTNVINTINNLVSVFPNPAQDYLNIQLAQHIFTNSEIELLNVQGNILKTFSASNQILVADLPPGIYFIRAGEQTCKFMKQ